MSLDYITDTEARSIYIHSGSASMVIGSDTEHNPPTNISNLNINYITGSGPLYNITFEGIDNTILNAKTGDVYLSMDVAGEDTSWYKYLITKIHTTGSYYVDATVKYIADSESWGGASPSDVYVQSHLSYDVVWYTRKHLICKENFATSFITFA